MSNKRLLPTWAWAALIVLFLAIAIYRFATG